MMADDCAATTFSISRMLSHDRIPPLPSALPTVSWWKYGHDASFFGTVKPFGPPGGPFQARIFRAARSNPGRDFSMNVVSTQ